MCYSQHSHPESKPISWKERSPVPVESRTVGSLRQFLGKPRIYAAQRTLRSAPAAAMSCILSRASHLPRAPLAGGCFRCRWSLLSSTALRVFSRATAPVSWELCHGQQRLRDPSCCATCGWECLAGMAWAPSCISRLFLAVGIWCVLCIATAPRLQEEVSVWAAPSRVQQMSWRLWQRC